MKLNKHTLSLSLFALLPLASPAAVVTWAPSVNLFAGGNNNAFISQNGTFLVGFNGGTTAATTTVGTSVFTAADSAAVNAGITGSGVTVSATNNNQAGPTTFNDGEFNSVGDVFNLINSAVFGVASGLGTVSLSGLTIGNTYEMQILVNDARGGGGAGIRDIEWKVGFNDGAGGTTIAGLADLTNRPFNNNGDPNLAGDFIIGTFVADATTQSFTYGATRGNNPGDEFDLGGALTQISGGQTQINAFQLRETAVAPPVPEPTTTALFGLGGLALLLRRRK